jgi:hypothetical protein
MDSGTGTRALPRVGFPIRTSRDHRMVSSSPGLFAAAHVLLRLLAPRHPPCALILLIRKNTCVAAMEFSRCTRTRRPPSRDARAARHGLSKLNSVVHRRARHCSRRTDCTGRASSSTGPAPTGVQSSGIPRKEVIQPQLPLRLPCYDFTPIIDPTFDGCLPEG